jgi:thioesterase domain-containing protein
MRLLFQDISFRYAKYSGQKPLRAHSPSPPFGDFVLWQQRWLHGDECDAQMQYWREKLGGMGALAALPLERLTDQSPARRGAQHTLNFSTEVAEKLKAHARELDATLFSVLLGVLKVLIRQCSGLDDVRVGSMMAKRNRVTTRRVVALLADNVLLRTDLGGARTLREVIERTRETVEGATQNQNVFFDQVTSQPEIAGLPAFEVYFAMMNVSNRVPFPNLEVETVETETGTAKIDLTVGVRQENDALQVDFIYDADMIAGDSVTRIAEQYGRLVEVLAADLDASLAALPFDDSLKSATPIYVQPLREAKASDSDDAPRDELERQLVEIWQRLLQVPRVGVRDDFFALGGHSLLAVRLLDTVEKATGKTLSLAIFFQAPTIEGQAALLREEDKLDSPSLVRLQPGGTRPPLFCIDGAVRYRALAQRLAPDQPVYGLIPANPTDGQWYSFDKIGERARHYLRIIKKVQPRGPYQVAGLSFAGLVALMIAKQLREDGDDVHLLALFDTYGPGYFAMPFSRRVGLHLHALRQLNAGERAQYFRDRARLRLGKKGAGANGAGGESHKDKAVATQTIERPEVPEDDWQVDVFARELSPEEQRHLRAMVQRTRRDPATARYEGETVLFVARDKPMEFLQADTTLGWGDYAPRLKLHAVAGDHTSLIQEPNVEQLAALLRSHLYPAPLNS